MANDKETVADIAREMYYSYEGLTAFEFQWYADRIEAAHKREVAELRRRLKVVEDSLCESRVAICHICDQKHICSYGTAKAKRARNGGKNMKRKGGEM